MRSTKIDSSAEKGNGVQDLGFLGVFLIILALVLGAIAAFTARRGKVARQNAQAGQAATVIDADRPRPRVSGFHVRGEEAQVFFDVPLPDGEIDEVLSELLTNEALEVVREKRHELPITGVTTVVALAGRGAEPRRVGKVALEEPGVLPPPMVAAPSLHLGHIGFDPLEKQFSGELLQHAPGLAAERRTETLGPIGNELRLPKAVTVGLRAQGVDPMTMTSAEMVRALLRLFGYGVTSTDNPLAFTATKAGSTTYLCEDRYEPGDHPEVEDVTMREFVMQFINSGADRGLLISDKFSPFGVYEREKREPRIRFVTRERLQKFVDALSLE
ncbi:MAG TPA: hypothetical protein VJ482_07370 [Acidimicrobiia bacterium]|nr:hypothetical protein [Acidimicrobiia bacterium]